jgi:hypothetical protein
MKFAKPAILIIIVLAVVAIVIYFGTRESISNPVASVPNSVVRMPIPQPNMSFEPSNAQPGSINERKYDTYPAPAPGQILTPIPVHQLRVEALRQ